VRGYHQTILSTPHLREWKLSHIQPLGCGNNDTLWIIRCYQENISLSWELWECKTHTGRTVSDYDKIDWFDLFEGRFVTRIKLALR